MNEFKTGDKVIYSGPNVSGLWIKHGQVYTVREMLKTGTGLQFIDCVLEEIYKEHGQNCYPSIWFNLVSNVTIPSFFD